VPQTILVSARVICVQCDRAQLIFPVMLGPTNLILPASRSSSSLRLTVFGLQPSSVEMVLSQKIPNFEHSEVAVIA